MKRVLVPVAAAAFALAVALVLGASSARADKASTTVAGVDRVVFFSSDGMRPDLMEGYAAAGAMPTYANLIATGARGANGLKQGFPPNTGVGWYTLATGTWPSEHGSTNNTYHRTGEGSFNNRTSFSAAGTLQADTLAAAAERAGKRVAQLDWVGGLNAGISGPTVDFASFFSNRGVLVKPVNAAEQAGAAAFGVNYEVASFTGAIGWAGVPAGDPAAPPQQTTWSIPSSFTPNNPNRTYNVYAYDSVVDGTAAYDHVVVGPVGKTGAPPSIDLAVGDFESIRLTGPNGLTGTRTNQSVGHYVKLISLAGDLSTLKLYATSLARAQAKCATAACNALPAGGAGEDRLEKHIADNLPVWVAADFAPLEGKVIDEETYVQQGRDLEREFGDAVMQFVLGTLQPNTDLAFVGYPVTDEFSHQFMGLVTPTDIDGNPNPYFDDLENDDIPDGRIAIREGFIRSAYHEADAKLALARTLMGGGPTTFASSDHGFAPQWLAVNVSKALVDLGLQSGEQSGNCRRATAGPTGTFTLAKECHAGGTAQIYLNVRGRDPETGRDSSGAVDNRPQIPAADYETRRNQIVAYFENLDDPTLPGQQKVVDRVLKKEQLRNVDGTDGLHPSRSGDVVVVFRPPYQTDAATPGQLIAHSNFFGQHGYLPDLVDIAHSVNMHGTFVAAGPGIRKQGPVAGVRAIDVAPTLAFLMGIPGPQNASGKILYQLFPTPGQLKEITILNISDYHGQLVPLTDTSDSLPATVGSPPQSTGAINPSFAIGGAAFLKPWFDGYRAQAAGGSITVAGGDSVGASPPISSQFEDKPTIELMNAMGFDADALGNHNFDKGQQFLRNTLIPLAKFAFLSANVVDSAGRTPQEWSPSKVFNFEGGKLGVIGFSNEDIPFLTFPGALGPFHVESATARVNAEAARLKANGVNAIVAIGHLGAESTGTLTSPVGPLVTLADGLSNVDAVLGDHTNVQVLANRPTNATPNGRLVTENLSKGIRFTRVRLVIDTNTKQVVYKTADFHKPWTIGVTPDPAIKARLDELNAILAPILGVRVADAGTTIPRSDACARFDGRLCESKIGDVITDSMLTAFKADFPAFDVDFAITNSGGIRADLTCPTTDIADDFCLAGLYPFPPGVFPITKGQVVTVLPFGNVVATAEVTGVQLQDVLENGVASMPSANGRFAQVSGLCFTYDISRTARTLTPTPVPNSGDRVLPNSVVFANADGSCTTNPVGLLSTDKYTVAINDFMAFGGDAYPPLVSQLNTPAVKTMDSVLEKYVNAKSPPGTTPPALNPTIQGRIKCVKVADPASANNCPAGSP